MINKKQVFERAYSLTSNFISFVNASPSPYHAVHNSIGLLSRSKSYEEIREDQDWNGRIAPGGNYIVTRGGSSLVAFSCGREFSKEETSFKIVGAHTDSPCLRLAPKSLAGVKGYKTGVVQTYGGGLWHTWLDRDLHIGGRVIIRQADGSLHARLYTSESSVGTI